MIEKIIHDLNTISNKHLIVQGDINCYYENICDDIEEYLSTLSSRIRYCVKYVYDYCEHSGFFTVAVYDTKYDDMQLFCYKYTSFERNPPNAQL